MKIGRRTHRNCRGTSTLEFIVVLPFLLIVMLTAVELSRMLFTYNTIVQATRDGARVGVVTPLTGTPPSSFDSGPATARINAILATSNLTASSVSVICPACAPDATVTATVTVNFQTWVPLLSSMFGSINLTHATYMRYE